SHEKTQKAQSSKKRLCAFCAFSWLKQNYIEIVPQAIRAPEFPDGSVVMSSAFSWMTSDVPPFEKSPLAASPNMTRVSVNVAFAVPLALTVKFSMSPACGPFGFFRPCIFESGLKCGPADAKSGPSHFAIW